MNTNTNRRGRSTSVRSTRGSSSRPQSRTSSRSSSSRGGFSGGRSKGFGGSRGGNRGRGGRGKKKLPTFNPSQFINKNPVEATVEVYKPTHTFADFGLDERIVKTVASIGITTPSPIQDQIIPEILLGRDVIGLAETGTGKTAAFLLPLIHKNLQDKHRQTLILAPTRELAIQIQEELQKLSQSVRMFSVVCVGGINIQPQIRSLKKTNQFVIGTPGRVMDLIKRKCIKPEDFSTVVLDEADRMLDMGFIGDMRTILARTPKDRETLFFSATMSDDIKGLVSEFLNNPITVSVKKKDVTNSIEQDVVPHQESTKVDTLLDLLSNDDFTRVIIFGAMKHSVEKLANQLSREGVKAESIHGNKSHSQRQRALNKFKKNEARVLVATDVAARGIHVDDVSHVINYDMPNTLEDYIHRIGRTGRGSKKGKALTFVPQTHAR